ncbi:hypothetical protein DGG96_02280 [Legionella qingyii]|uniref:Uncharacterized protein n=1 Tax=Legionella qingyii TaxID=2184757 RepID=A0A317U6I9_9GAMM|nr:hypothetical protein [Legionella qingyii]PWY56486.1 hypothetical protein DGG96_06910 [Legionella qingyii]PWY57157.1 hypothetical protein DGG96_02280 [Legionella qingyii]RUR25003.1 hypothetical protein ELY20_04395 [Legionella qingyii]RUR28725.1 hypothetical protein ELY16_01585 [Legionella qingyii]
MPSSQLAVLCQHIENQDTDHFGKFYMYVSLLNTLTARNKSFADGLPQYSGTFFGGKKALNIGEIPAEFTKQLNIYAQEFINLQPHWSKSLHNLVMAYIRKGKVSDLIYIIDQMLSHLASIHGKQSHNNKIYDDINFAKNKENLTGFIKEISAFNQQLLSITDNSCNAALSLLAVTTGLVLVFTIAPLIISLPLVLGGLYGVYHFAAAAMAQIESLELQMQQISQKMENLPQDRSLFGNVNHNAFYTAVIKPLPYAAITAAEQFMVDESQQEQLKGYRQGLDLAFNSAMF